MRNAPVARRMENYILESRVFEALEVMAKKKLEKLSQNDRQT